MRAAAAIAALALAGCSHPWVTARGAITAADAAMEALPDDIVGPEQRDDLQHAREGMDAALDLGRLACDVWEREAGDAPAGWQKWIDDALTASSDVIDLLKACGVDVPIAVVGALAALQALLPLLGG